MKGVLFDLDGTLIDSMYAHFEAWKFVLKSYDIDLSKKKYFAMEGMSMKLIAFQLLKNKYKNLEIDDSLIEYVVQKKKITYRPLILKLSHIQELQS